MSAARDPGKLDTSWTGHRWNYTLIKNVCIFQTHQIVYIKYLQLSVCQSYLNKMIFSKKKNMYVDLCVAIASNIPFKSTYIVSGY